MMKEDQKKGTKPLEILIAEDEKNIGDLLVELLSRDDRKITVVHNGLEAIRKLRQHPFDLLITDLMMPEVDGMEVLHQARKLYPQILVIIITGYASLETAIQAVKEGAYDYLRKPFRLEELKISVDNACERIQLIRENQLLLDHLRSVCQSKEKTDSQEIAKKGDGGANNSGYLGMDWIPPSFFEPGKEKNGDALAELERLGNLRQQGFITKEEFEALKKKLLDRI